MSANGINGTAPERSDSAPTSATIARIETGKAGKCEGDSGVSATGSFRNGNARSRQMQKQVVEFTPEVLESKRAAILKERQAVLKHAMDRHDDLVRLAATFLLFMEGNNFFSVTGAGTISYAAIHNDDKV
jgi:hypothetical protein